jgi:hypothetical protein
MFSLSKMEKDTGGSRGTPVVGLLNTSLVVIQVANINALTPTKNPLVHKINI